MSKAIIAPRIAPSTTAFPPRSVASHAPMNFIRSAMGGPTTLSITAPTTSEQTIGMIRIGMIGLMYFGAGACLTKFTQ